MSDVPLPIARPGWGHPGSTTSWIALRPAGLDRSATTEAVGLLLGVAFTAALFLTMARIDQLEPQPTVASIDDLRRVAAPLPLPPPPPAPSTPSDAAAADLLPLAGLELGASDSPVAVNVVPPDLETLLPATTALSTRTRVAPPRTDLPARVNLEVDVGRIYQESEIDQRVRALVRAVPAIPGDVSADAASLRVLLLLLIDQQGKVVSARVVEPSGKPEFDAIVARCVETEWRFTPATRRGRKVKVLAQQAIRINFRSGGSPFSLDR